MKDIGSLEQTSIMRILILVVFLMHCFITEAQVKKLNEAVSPLFDPALKPFYHGVASGDPLKDRVIIWTRVTPEDSVQEISVKWEVSENKNFSNVLKNGALTTTPARDYTVKVDVTGLKSGKNYFYRFNALGKTSMIGKTKTISTGTIDSLKFAVVSCSNWEFGYFNAYDRISEKNVDAVIHLGDYIYEYQTGRYGNKNSDRKNLPPHEIVTLQDYRTRYSQYHLDKGLRNVRQQHPFITIWDDHEFANDAYSTGAQNHQTDLEGEYSKRQSNAKQAYYEWIPIRKGEHHYRRFAFGNLVDLLMLDERLEGRTKQADSVKQANFNDANRSMLGDEQLKWFEKKLKDSKAVWKVVGNQVLFSDLNQFALSARRPQSLDSWDGYPAEKKKLAKFIQENNLNNIVFLAGDTHASWAFEAVASSVAKYNPENSSGALAVELATPSITSSNDNESRPDSVVLVREKSLLRDNPHLKYINHRDHGYILLTLYPDRGKAEWFYVEELLKPDNREHRGKKITFSKNSNHIK